MRRIARYGFIVLPVLVIAAVVLKEAITGRVWLGRDGHGLQALGETVVRAPVSFHGSTWSVWNRIEGDSVGGWSRSLRLPRRAMEFRTLVGLHPDFYESGRTHGASTRVIVVDGDMRHVMGAVELMPGPDRRHRPFVPLQVGLDQWAGRKVTLLMEVRAFQGQAIEVLWIEPRIVPAGTEDW